MESSGSSMNSNTNAHSGNSKVLNKTALRSKTVGGSKGITFKSVFVPKNTDPFEMVTWERRRSKISDAGGASVFEMDDVMVPSTWSQLATDIAVSKYFRKAGVPGTGSEKSVKQLVYRVANTIRKAGEKMEYFK